MSSEGCEALESCLLPPCFHTNFWFLCICMRKNCIYLQIIWKGISNIYSMSSVTFLSSITCLLEYCILNILGNTLSWMLSLALHFFKENSAKNILHYLKQTNTNNVALLLKRPLTWATINSRTPAYLSSCYHYWELYLWNCNCIFTSE